MFVSLKRGYCRAYVVALKTLRAQASSTPCCLARLLTLGLRYLPLDGPPESVFQLQETGKQLAVLKMLPRI